jgi:hypothetical protein
VGATSLISTIAYSVQHLMEIQVESERRGSGTGTPQITSRPG